MHFVLKEGLEKKVNTLGEYLPLVFLITKFLKNINAWLKFYNNILKNNSIPDNQINIELFRKMKQRIQILYKRILCFPVQENIISIFYYTKLFFNGNTFDKNTLLKLWSSYPLFFKLIYYPVIITLNDIIITLLQAWKIILLQRFLLLL